MTGVALTIVGIFAFLVIRTYVWQYKAKLTGVDAEAQVSWIEHVVRHAFGDGARYPITYYYVMFQKEDGSVTEARLLNPNKRLQMGSRVRIRDNPGHENVATLMEIED